MFKQVRYPDWLRIFIEDYPEVENTPTNRLKALADFLEILEPRLFSIGAFAHGKLDYCQSAGCALGWCTVIFDGWEMKDVRPQLSRCDPHVNPNTFWDAAQFFDLSTYVTHELFMRYGYLDGYCVTPDKVAVKINKLLETGDLIKC